MKGMRRIALALGAAALLATATAAALAAPASAAATVTIDYFTASGGEGGLTDDCRPGLTGTIFGTSEFRFETVETAVGFHFNGTETGTGRIEWSDGSYSITKTKDHYSFNAGNGTKTVVFTLPHVDTVTDYTAEGVFLARTSLHRVEHFTITDGVVRVDFDHFHFVGGC